MVREMGEKEVVSDMRIVSEAVDSDGAAYVILSIHQSGVLPPPPSFSPPRPTPPPFPPFKFPNLALTFPTTPANGLLGTSSTSTNLLINRLKILPNPNAITVLVKMITLYGILKSGVGSGNNRLVVLRYPPSSPNTRIIAGGTSNPRFASGGYSVYLSTAFSKS